MHLAASLRAGDVALVGGDSYADYREQLLPWMECQQRLPTYCAKVALPEMAIGLVQAVKDELTRVAAKVDSALPTLKDDVAISAEGQPVLKRVVAKEVPGLGSGTRTLARSAAVPETARRVDQS